MLCESLHFGLYFDELRGGYGYMVHLLGNLGILIDYGSNEPGSILQHQIHKGRHYVWQDFLVDGNRLIALSNATLW